MDLQKAIQDNHADIKEILSICDKIEQIINQQ